MKRTQTSKKRLALEPERVRNLVVELTPEQLERVDGGGGFIDTSTTGTQNAVKPYRLE